MNFYAIGPLAYLNAICGEGYPYHMCLAQYLYDEDFTPTDYFMYYRRRASLHKYKVILDNGCYENAKVSDDILLRATTELNPDVFVLPDCINNMGATLTYGEAFKVMLKRQGWKGKTMTVVQAAPGNLDQWCHAYMEACKQSPWVGIPRNQTSGLSRACFLAELKSRKVYNTHTTHHALGMKDGSLEELREMAASTLVASCDSSSPIWRGFNTYSLTKMADSIWPDYPFDPLAVIGGGNTLEVMQTNFGEVLTACR